MAHESQHNCDVDDISDRSLENRERKSVRNSEANRERKKWRATRCWRTRRVYVHDYERDAKTFQHRLPHTCLDEIKRIEQLSIDIHKETTKIEGHSQAD